MSEDTPVNTGVSWPDEILARALVRKMQVKLHRWAGDDHSRRFTDLFNLVHDPAFLTAAWQRVSTNTGARTAGVDRATVSYIVHRIGVSAFLDQVRDLLKSGQFRPTPVRQVMIPKPSGKVRKLGIPTVTDRVVQAALKLVLEPIFEVDFLPCSYGFRPMRRAHDAIAEIHAFTSRPRDYEWIVEADIAACFDEIDHVALMDRVRVRIKDKKILALVKAFLKAGVMTGTGERHDSWRGTPQGGILSPLLANVALTALDEHFDRQWKAFGDGNQRHRRRARGLATWRLVRYADDFVVLVKGHQHHAEALLDDIAQVIAPLGLRLADDKTRVVHIDHGFDFLGHTIVRRTKRGSHKTYVFTYPSRKAMRAVRDRTRECTQNRSTLYRDLDEILLTLGRSLRGWANYFRHGSSSRHFQQVDYHAWKRIGAWIRRKHHPIPWREVRHRFTHGGRYAHNGITFHGATSVKIERYRYRGSKIPNPWTTTTTTTT
ncbi:group II intron reverse transcriptase/maturase [Micromonospora sp. NPDC048830]|uniref:group II intron reverse transcriptase/maturase n=1 Tax=Micromonospora sp. NPDC048830 TaxID=3364257 RepID=UPI003714F676